MIRLRNSSKTRPRCPASTPLSHRGLRNRSCDAPTAAGYAPVLDFFNSLPENRGWTLVQFNFTVGVRGSISNVDRTEPLSFLSTLKALGITSRANLEKIRKVTAKRAFEAHDLLLRSYYAAKSAPRTDFSGIVGNVFAFQHRLRLSK